MFRALIMRAVTNLIAGAFIAFLVVVGTGFLFAAAYLFLATRLDPPLAALAMGAGVLAAALVTGLVVWKKPAAGGPRAGRPGAAPEAADVLASGDVGQIGDAARRFTALNPGTAAVAAFAVGATLGISPAMRRAAADLLRQWSETR